MCVFGPNLLPMNCLNIMYINNKAISNKGLGILLSFNKAYYEKPSPLNVSMPKNNYISHAGKITFDLLFPVVVSIFNKGHHNS